MSYWGLSAILNFDAENYKSESAMLQSMKKEEVVAMLRRSSTGFSRGASKFRGVTRHHQHGKWEARIGRVAGNKYLVIHLASGPLLHQPFVELVLRHL